MSRLTPTLLALALALALSATPVCAQQINTSHGIRTLPRTDGMKSEAQYRQAARTAEETMRELLQDLTVIEGSRQAAVTGAGTITEQVKKANVDYERSRTALAQADQQYRTELSSFQDRQARLESDIQQQRSQAAVLQQLPSAQQDHAEVVRLNAWADKISNERKALETEGARLLAEHDSLETDRAKMAKQKADAEAGFKGARDSTVGAYGSAEQKRVQAYADLRTCVKYLRTVRDQLGAVAKQKLPNSAVLDEANNRLRAYESSSVKR